MLVWISPYLRQISSVGSGFPIDMAAKTVCAEKDDETWSSNKVGPSVSALSLLRQLS